MDWRLHGRGGVDQAGTVPVTAAKPKDTAIRNDRTLGHSMRVTAFCAGFACILVSGFALGAPAVQTHGNPVPPEPTVVHTGTQAMLPAVRVDAALKDYDHWLDQLAQENRTAGLATAVVINDKVRYERTIGYADANTGAKVDRKSVGKGKTGDGGGRRCT